MENLTQSFREPNLVFQLTVESQIKSKAVMNWSSRKKKEGIFCTVYFVQRKFFFQCIVSVLNTRSEYSYFYISNSIVLPRVSYIKIVKSLNIFFVLVA